MNAQEFKLLVAGAGTVGELDRVMGVEFARVAGSLPELVECQVAGQAKWVELEGPSVIRGTAWVPDDFATRLAA